MSKRSAEDPDLNLCETETDAHRSKRHQLRTIKSSPSSNAATRASFSEDLGSVQQLVHDTHDQWLSDQQSSELVPSQQNYNVAHSNAQPTILDLSSDSSAKQSVQNTQNKAKINQQISLPLSSQQECNIVPESGRSVIQNLPLELQPFSIQSTIVSSSFETIDQFEPGSIWSSQEPTLDGIALYPDLPDEIEGGVLSADALEFIEQLNSEADDLVFAPQPPEMSRDDETCEDNEPPAETETLARNKTPDWNEIDTLLDLNSSTKHPAKNFLETWMEFYGEPFNPLSSEPAMPGNVMSSFPDTKPNSNAIQPFVEHDDDIQEQNDAVSEWKASDPAISSAFVDVSDNEMQFAHDKMINDDQNIANQKPSKTNTQADLPPHLLATMQVVWGYRVEKPKAPINKSKLHDALIAAGLAQHFDKRGSLWVSSLLRQYSLPQLGLSKSEWAHITTKDFDKLRAKDKNRVPAKRTSNHRGKGFRQREESEEQSSTPSSRRRSSSRKSALPEQESSQDKPENEIIVPATLKSLPSSKSSVHLSNDEWTSAHYNGLAGLHTSSQDSDPPGMTNSSWDSSSIVQTPAIESSYLFDLQNTPFAPGSQQQTQYGHDRYSAGTLEWPAYDSKASGGDMIDQARFMSSDHLERLHDTGSDMYVNAFHQSDLSGSADVPGYMPFTTIDQFHHEYCMNDPRSLHNPMQSPNKGRMIFYARSPCYDEKPSHQSLSQQQPSGPSSRERRAPEEDNEDQYEENRNRRKQQKREQ